MVNKIKSIHPPRLACFRYRTIFIYLQISNVLRYYTCPDEYDYQMPHSNFITSIIIPLISIFAFLHTLDGTKQNWLMVQYCMFCVSIAYILDVILCLYQSITSYQAWKALSWDIGCICIELLITAALFEISRAEKNYLEDMENLERINIENGGPRRRKRYRRRRNVRNREEELSIVRNRYSH